MGARKSREMDFTIPVQKKFYIFKYFELFKGLPNLESFSCRQNIRVSKWMIKGQVRISPIVNLTAFSRL